MLLIALKLSLIITGIYTSTQDGMIFGFIRPLLFSLPVWLKKPLYLCLTCMASFWTLALWLLFANAYTWHVIPVVFIVAGLNSIVISILEFYPSIYR